MTWSEVVDQRRRASDVWKHDERVPTAFCASIKTLPSLLYGYKAGGLRFAPTRIEGANQCSVAWMQRENIYYGTNGVLP